MQNEPNDDEKLRQAFNHLCSRINAQIAQFKQHGVSVQHVVMGQMEYGTASCYLSGMNGRKTMPKQVQGIRIVVIPVPTFLLLSGDGETMLAMSLANGPVLAQ